ncbi:MAG: Dabb family protein [Candidatus Dadabacteria bacterium]|nr:Dabb family protein [Candidatus Dadabacteria bacterium]NIS08641.1 Dabb family protein [Candidatus Dadabacteria bacterium]NIV42475.1 Dabb family protein [Candidatus Dadabacteria bacterium]NIX15357.1 Dabb family protein [Candidatus Dadabacteria bacterium]NIY22016.1 Dabb family protein [Candidatus Dadabacteria bacterium]
MIKHIVMWKLKDTARGVSKEENAKELKSVLEALKGKIDVIKEIEVGIDFNKSQAAYDVALYSVFDSKEDLQTYQKHPDHVKVVDFVNEIRDERVVVDYEI